MQQSAAARLFMAFVLAATMAACTSSSRTTETTGAYIDDSAITTKVKEVILAEPGLRSLQISVETYKDVVQLSGFVDTPQSRTRAGELAAGVAGVKSVKNDLVVKG